ncbi:hypothetical protein [Burkholderia cepacia]|uniref:hypothetical protein n=1 Tax=Burkholderia cepacia TaxID=292 RepID=UPI0012D9EEB9|nr:hypothetical protein [Burkholderia cepacia]
MANNNAPFFLSSTGSQDEPDGQIRMNNEAAARQHGDELTPERVFVGISVTREILEVDVSSLRVILGYRNETYGIESLTDAIAEWAPARIVLESSGGAESHAACALQAARLPVAVAHAHQARDFIAGAAGMPPEGKGARARLLSSLAREFDRYPMCARLAEPLSDPPLQYVQALVQRRRQLASTMMARISSARAIARERARRHRADHRVPERPARRDRPLLRSARKRAACGTRAGDGARKAAGQLRARHGGRGVHAHVANEVTGVRGSVAPTRPIR